MNRVLSSSFNIFISATIIALCGCKSHAGDPVDVPSFSSNKHLNAVIEIPAGTNHKYEYDRETKKFEVDERDGKKRIVNFLSYPLNYGFVASTTMDRAKGGDGDPLDVLVIAEHIETGTVLEVIPVGLLLMTDKGEQDHKVLAIPADASKRTIDVKDFNELSAKYPAVKTILEVWFANYDPGDPKQMLGWKDEKAAIEEVMKWQINPSASK